MDEQLNSYLIRSIFFSGILGLSLVVSPTTSHASSGDDLVQAASAGNLPKVRTMLNKGAKINHQNEYGTTALMAASRRGRVETVQTLLAKGAEINRQSNYGVTALMAASRRWTCSD